MLGGRGGRPDDWTSPHQRAQSRAAERLAGPIDPVEAAWLDDHLESCSDCAAAAMEYVAQRRELRAMRDHAPVPPRDLWARTAASIEREARHRALTGGGRSRGGLLAPYALLAGALVVAVVIGSLTSSRQIPGTATTAPASQGVGPSAPLVATDPTPIAVAPRDVGYVVSQVDGGWEVGNVRVHEVCPESDDACATTEPGETRDIGPLSSPEAVYGSVDGQLIVVGSGEDGSSIVVLAPDESPAPTETSSEAPTATASVILSASPSFDASSAPSVPPSIAPPSTSVEPSTSPRADGSIEIARDIEVIDTTAAYAPDGSAFAFTAAPVDGSHGPDIYLWRAGDREAVPITTDHRSVFGSWSGGMIVGSTVTADGTLNEPAAFVLAGGTTDPVLRPETGLVWRPAVDPNGELAVYWAGTLEPDGDRWVTESGRLVIGRWNGASDTTGGGALPTPLTGNQASERSETTIARGPLGDWDARWDKTGTRLAVWIADEDDPSVGRLSLYVVDPFSGDIDLDDPPLSDEPAAAGFSIADGRLAWAVPSGTSAKADRVKILAWTDAGFGEVETATGDVLLVR
jgi:anti-sigma factor RsiW